MLLNSIGTQAIQAHNVQLANHLYEGLLVLGLPVCQPQDGKNLTHVVSLGSLNPASNTVEVELLHRLYVYLELNRVRSSWRNGILRFSIHLYNNTADIQNVLSLTREFVTLRK